MAKITAVIQAGGLGTRMRELTQDRIPKPMLELNGKPLLLWQIENISAYGIKDFVIVIGHLGQSIKEYFDDGSKYGIHIDYISEDKPLGSAGALFYLNSNSSDLFLLIYGDVMFDMDLDRWINFHLSKKALISMVCHPTSHPYDSDLLLLDSDNRVIKFLWKTEKRDGISHNIGNAGLFLFDRSVLHRIQTAQKIDWEKDIIANELETGRVYGYRTCEYIKDVGMPDRFKLAALDQIEGKWRKKNLNNKQKCIFLDRDGTINILKGLISCPEQLELEKNVDKAIRIINNSEYLVIVITNQPVVARGMCQIEDVEKIHGRLETLLGEKNVFLDDIAFCPHHPDRGYPEENPVYKVKCSCRKPMIGMIREMAKKYNIDLEKSYMIGDTTVDIQTGVNAGLTTILLRTGEAGNDGKYMVTADYECEDLLEAVNFIMKSEV